MNLRFVCPWALATIPIVFGCGSVVDPPPDDGGLRVTPASVTVALGASAQLSAEVTDASGRASTPPEVTWSSDNPLVATVDVAGVVTGRCGGTAVITAAVEGASAQATVTVEPPTDPAPPDTYVIWSPRVIDVTTTDPLHLTVRTSNGPGVMVDLASGGPVPLCRIATHTYEVTLDSRQALVGYTTGDLHGFVGFLEIGGFRGNLFINISDATVPDATVSPLSATVQHTDRVVNIVFDELLLGSQIPPPVVQALYAHFPDDYDFIAIVEQVASFHNRGYWSVRNDTRGVGLIDADRSAAFGSAGRLQGLILFPIASLFDLGETAASHELGHRWINFLGFPTLAVGTPHWPISSLAHGVMGINIPGSNVGGQFPFELVRQPDGDYRLECVGPGTEFLDLELYLMGLLPADSVGGHFVFTNQAQGSALGCDRTLRGPVEQFTIADVIAAEGPRYPAWPDTQRHFRIATIVLSRDRLLTDRELSFFDHMAARGSATEELWFTSGFASGMTKPFHLATGGRATLETRLR